METRALPTSDNTYQHSYNTINQELGVDPGTQPMQSVFNGNGFKDLTDKDILNEQEHAVIHQQVEEYRKNLSNQHQQQTSSHTTGNSELDLKVEAKRNELEQQARENQQTLTAEDINQQVRAYEDELIGAKNIAAAEHDDAYIGSGNEKGEAQMIEEERRRLIKQAEDEKIEKEKKQEEMEKTKETLDERAEKVKELERIKEIREKLETGHTLLRPEREMLEDELSKLLGDNPTNNSAFSI